MGDKAEEAVYRYGSVRSASSLIKPLYPAVVAACFLQVNDFIDSRKKLWVSTL